MRRVEQQLGLLAASTLPRVLMISHGIGGGVERHINELVQLLRGRAHVLILEPVSGRRMLRLTVPKLAEFSIDEQSNATMSLAYRWPKDADVFWQLLKWLGVSRVHVHHAQGFTPNFWSQLDKQALPYDLTLHDHSIFTGHASLVNSKGVFEPAWLEQNLASLPQGNKSLAQSLQCLALAAQRVIVPSKQLFQAVQTLLPEIAGQVCLLHRAHPDAECEKAYPQPYLRELAEQEPLRVLCLGMLSIEKGAGVLAQVAEQASAAALPFEFILLGSCHVPLPAAVKRLGSYADTQVQELIAQINPHIVWLPAQCPETWSYTLSAAFKAGLPVLTSDVGVFPERLQGRPLSWQCAHRGSAQLWLAELIAIRELHHAQPAAEFWSWVPPPLFYFEQLSLVQLSDSLARTYWLALPVPKAEILPEQVAQSLAGAYKRANLGVAKWRAALLNLLLWLRNAGCFTPLLRIIPYAWQQKIKRMITREPLAERRKPKKNK